jgi:ATP-dependent Lon protease
MVEQVIQGYTREAGVRNLGRHLAALARAAAVKVAEYESSEHPTSKMQSEVLSQGGGGGGGGGGGVLGDSGEVEMEVEAVSVSRHKTLPLAKLQPLVVDEAVLEIVLGVSSILHPLFMAFYV